MMAQPHACQGHTHGIACLAVSAQRSQFRVSSPRECRGESIERRCPAQAQAHTDLADVQTKLAELKEQLARAVQPDSNLRVFYCGPYATAPLPGLLPGGGSVDVGLVFTCTHGTVDLTERGICGAASPLQTNVTVHTLQLPACARFQELRLM